eukprot:gene27536-32850_t
MANNTHTVEWSGGDGVHGFLEYIAQEAYFQITSNPVYSSTFATLSVVMVAYSKAKFQRAIANVFLTQVQLEREASEKIRKYAAFQLQDSAKWGDEGEIQDYKSYNLKRVAGTQPTTASFKLAKQSSGTFWMPDVLQVVPPRVNPTLRGPPIGCGPGWKLTFFLALALLL